MAWRRTKSGSVRGSRDPATPGSFDRAAGSEPAHETSTASTKRRLGAVIGGGAAGAAIITALATAVITPGRVDGVFQWLASLFTPSSISQTDSLEKKTVTSPDQVFTLDVPRAWLTRDGTLNPFPDPTLNVGSAMYAGADADLGAVSFDTPGSYIGASVYAAKQLALVGSDRDTLQQWATTYRTPFDWAAAACALTSDPVPQRDGWVIGGRVWKDCAANAGMRLFEGFALPESGSYIVYFEVTLMGDDSDEIAEMIVQSVAVNDTRVETVDPVAPDTGAGAPDTSNGQ